MKTNYTDKQLQSAIDEAFAKGYKAETHRFFLSPSSFYWDQEAPNRLSLIKSALASLPEPEPPTVDGKTPEDVMQSVYYSTPADEYPFRKAASAVLAAFGKQSQAAEEANARAEKAEAELARIIEAAHEAGWNGVENPKDLAQFIKYLAEAGAVPEPLVTKPISLPEWTPQVGDVVTLKSGGPNMTVVKLADTESDLSAFLCEWFSAAGEYDAGVIYLTSLQPA